MAPRAPVPVAGPSGRAVGALGFPIRSGEPTGLPRLARTGISGCAELGGAGVDRGIRMRVRAILSVEGTDEPPSLP